jgi:hypothetical protein
MTGSRQGWEFQRRLSRLRQRRRLSGDDRLNLFKAVIYEWVEYARVIGPRRPLKALEGPRRP